MDVCRATRTCSESAYHHSTKDDSSYRFRSVSVLTILLPCFSRATQPPPHKKISSYFEFFQQQTRFSIILLFLKEIFAVLHQVPVGFNSISQIFLFDFSGCYSMFFRVLSDFYLDLLGRIYFMERKPVSLGCTDFSVCRLAGRIWCRFVYLLASGNFFRTKKVLNWSFLLGRATSFTSVFRRPYSALVANFRASKRSFAYGRVAHTHTNTLSSARFSFQSGLPCFCFFFC